jgi:hypothetical protein
MAGLNREVTINSLPYIKKEIEGNRWKYLEVLRNSKKRKINIDVFFNSLYGVASLNLKKKPVLYGLVRSNVNFKMLSEPVDLGRSHCKE